MFDFFSSTLLRIVILFIPMACVGTLTHEMGHIAVAQMLGHGTTLHYASMNYDNLLHLKSRELREKIKRERRGPTTEERMRLEHLQDTIRRDSILITLGGPLQTMLTGTLGLLLLRHFRSRPERKSSPTLSRGEWIALLPALFWSRQVFNGLTGAVRSIFDIHRTSWGDEIRLAYHWQLPSWSIALGTALVGLAACLYVVFRLTPKRLRIPLCMGGVTGSLAGYMLWMKLIGPIVLP